MRSHEAVRMDPPAVAARDGAEQMEKEATVVVLAEEEGAAVAHG